jgi:phosphatidylglycerol:prolipoprotein diacylglycerol transferase
MQTDPWVHNLNPFLIRFSDSLGIRWYGLAYLVGFIVGALIMVFIANRGRGALSPRRVADFITYVVLGTMIGGRIGYALFYGPELLSDFSSRFPYWGLLKVWEGGMASHGGILGVALAAFLFARRYKMNWLHLGDLVTLGGSVGIFFGRIANFINGELFGREAAPWFPFPVKFPNEMYIWLKLDFDAVSSGRNATQLLKMTTAVKALGLNPSEWTQWLNELKSSVAARNAVQYQIERVVRAIQDGNETVRSALGAELTARYPSQLIEAGLEGLLLFIITLIFWRKPRLPGYVAVTWLASYAIVRIIGEQFRMPDQQLGYQLFGLTRGQWLSIAMLAISAVIYFYANWRAKKFHSPVIAGWGRAAIELRKREPLPFQGEG